MNGHTQHLQGQHPDGDRDRDRDQPLQNDSFTQTQTQTQTAAGSKTSSPTKRLFASFGLDDSHDTSALKKARLTSQVDSGEDSALFEKNIQDTPLQHPRPRRFLSPFVHPLDPLDAFVSQWLQTVGSSERKRNCRSDSLLNHLQDEEQTKDKDKVKVKETPKRTQSAPPAMDRKDADGFAIPRTPVSRGRSTSSGSSLRGRQPRGSEYTRDSSSSRSGSRIAVEHHNYRRVLATNNIHMRPYWEPLPKHVNSLMTQMSLERHSPEPTNEDLLRDPDRYELFQGTGEAEVEKYYTDKVLPSSQGYDAVKTRMRVPMSRQVVPNVGGTAPKFCTPTPDLLYGYGSTNAFPDAGQQSQLETMAAEVMANNDYSTYNALIFPFFVVEFKGVAGSMWVAGNQCLAGAATCVSIAEKLNRRLYEYAQSKLGKGKGSSSKSDGVTAVASVDSTAFSVAMNGQDARLYVSWKQDELNYYMANVDCYALSRPDEYKRFRRMVRNIVDWGRNDRLKAIQRGLDQLLEEAQERTPAPDIEAEGEAEAAAMDLMAMPMPESVPESVPEPMPEPMPEPTPEPTPSAGASKASRQHSPPSDKGSSDGGRSKKPRT